MGSGFLKAGHSSLSGWGLSHYQLARDIWYLTVTEQGSDGVQMMEWVGQQQAIRPGQLLREGNSQVLAVANGVPGGQGWVQPVRPGRGVPTSESESGCT